MEVTCALLQEKYHVEIEIKSLQSFIWKTVKKAEYTIHIEVPPNPFWASIGLSVAQLPLGAEYSMRDRFSWIFKSIVSKCSYGGIAMAVNKGAVWLECDGL